MYNWIQNVCGVQNINEVQRTWNVQLNKKIDIYFLLVLIDHVAN